MRFRVFAGLLLAVGAVPALAEEREFCPERPGLDTPACILDPGKLQFEVGMADWTLDKQPDSRTDDVIAGDLLLRYGVGPSTEVRFGWTAFGHERVRDRATGAVSHAARTGDITLGIKQGLLNPDGDKLSIAILPSVSLPVGRSPIGAGDWGGSLLLPTTYELNDTIQLEFTPEVDAAVDQDGNGRHLAYSFAGGVGVKLGKALTATGELQTMRDDDPSGHETEDFASLSLAYQFGKDVQLDVGGVAGLNHAAPDAELYFGVSHRF